MVKLMQDAADGIALNNYTFTLAGAADEITAGLIKGDIPIAAVPCNLAAVLNQRSEGNIKILAVNTLGVLYILERGGNSINAVSDLAGKTIVTTGKGTTPEYTLNYLLRSAGLDPDNDLTIEYKSEASEVAALMAAGEADIAMLPQPYVSVVQAQDDTVRIALDVAAEWERFADDGSTVVTGVLVANNTFYETNKAAVDTFLTEYEASVTFVTAPANLDAAASYCEQFDIIKTPLAKKAIPFCNIVYLRGTDAQSKVLAYLNVLFAQNPAAVGGVEPDAETLFVK
jgi:NitT/TauT family transport system substrate-binding protein